MRLPGEYWEGLKLHATTRSWRASTPTREGNVYAASNDGYLVRLDFEHESSWCSASRASCAACAA